LIESIKDLEKLLKLCRKQGVTEIKIHGAEIKLGELPPEQHAAAVETDPAAPYANFPQGELSPTQLMFYSSGGLPENDPELQVG